MSLAMSRFVLGCFVGVAYCVTFLVSRARSTIFMLGTGNKGDGVGRRNCSRRRFRIFR